MVSSVTILDCSTDPEGNNDVQTRSSLGNKHCCCLTHKGPIGSGCKVIHKQLMCNISSRANLLTGYSSCLVPGDIISDPFYDLYSHGSVRRGAAIYYLSIWTRACNKERQDVCDERFFFSARVVSWIKGVVKQRRSWQQNGSLEALHSADGHCDLQYTQPYSNLCYITSRI